MTTVELTQGTIHYDEVGPADGRPVLCVHGFLMGRELWAGLAERLASRGLRVLSPTWPLGAHPEAMRSGADTSPAGVASTIAAFMDAVALEDVVLIGNDSGGALCQVVAVEHSDRVGALVLTNCDMFDDFPPSFFKALVPAARSRRAFRAALAPFASATMRRSPLGYGMLSHHDVDHLAEPWARSALSNPGAFDDMRRFAAGMDPSFTQDAARRLAAFDRPALIAWGTDDKLFPLEHARRMASIIPGARLEEIADSRCFCMVDQPDALAALVADFAGDRAALRP